MSSIMAIAFFFINIAKAILKGFRFLTPVGTLVKEAWRDDMTFKEMDDHTAVPDFEYHELGHDHFALCFEGCAKRNENWHDLFWRVFDGASDIMMLAIADVCLIFIGKYAIINEKGLVDFVHYKDLPDRVWKKIFRRPIKGWPAY